MEMTDRNNVFMQMLETIEANANNDILINEFDYQKDGLWYCGKCDTPKQAMVKLFGSVRKPMCLCKCEAEKRDREREEFEQSQRKMRIAEMKKTGFPESEMCHWTFETDDGQNEKVKQIAKKYVDNFGEMLKRGKGLLFFGDVGTGKTFYSACSVNAVIDKGYPCMITNFARLVNTISGMYEGKQQYIAGLNRSELLGIDDLAAERDTEYMNEIVYNIIDSRYRAGLPTIITTNLSAEEIKNPADISKRRTYSRLLEMCVPVEVKGKDRRREKLKDDYSELKNILGL